MMKLSENFTLKELIKTSTGIANAPDKRQTEKLFLLTNYILQPIRDKFDKLKTTSGFRSILVNIKVGGAAKSEHKTGGAVDFIPVYADIDKVFEWIVTESGIKYGQVINEKKNGKQWIHISLMRIGKPNQQALVYDGKTYKPFKPI